MYSTINRRSIFILFSIFLLFSFDSALGQSEQGSIKGLVINTEKIPLAGANIILPKLERGATTNSRGEFQINQLPAGTYTVVIKFIGYKSKTNKVTVKPGATSHLQLELNRSVLDSEPVIITGSPVAVDPLNSPQDVSSIGGREKIRLQSTSLGKTIESIPGIYNMSAGSVAGKPIIRGQTGERIRILNDGVAQEYQQYGERHAPNIDPFNAERIEIIKGAASLLYGSDAWVAQSI